MTSDEQDLIEVKNNFPYIVFRDTSSSIHFSLGRWVLKNIGDDMIIMNKEILNMYPYLVRITYAFKHECDAIAFKLKFP